VKVYGGETKGTLLKPGQQAIIKDTLTSIVVRNIDTTEALAWKNGFFYFDNADTRAIMRLISRWYDVDIKYEGAIPEHFMQGKMQRTIPLSSALKILALNKINFRQQGRTIIVMP
jgi:ferric-dicitrate binding protein FerR (iron transport regulator)